MAMQPNCGELRADLITVERSTQAFVTPISTTSVNIATLAACPNLVPAVTVESTANNIERYHHIGPIRAWFVDVMNFLLKQLILKLFIIPWVWTRAQNVPSNPAVAAVPSAPNGQLDIPFYQFLQRQNQINNAILLNNAMLANSLTAMPSSEHHQIPIPSAMHFQSAGHPLQASHAALFPNFQPKFPTVPTTGLNQLGLYDVLSHPVKLDGVPSVLIPTHVVSTSTTASPPVGTTTAGEEPDKAELQESEPIPIGVSEPDERMKKVINLAATPRPKPTETTDSPALTELIEEIGEENLLTTTTEQLIEATSAKAPKPDVYRLLKTLNLTDEETNDLVSHVEKVVREELVRKLAEARLSEHMTSTSQKPSNDVSTTETTTVQSSTAFESEESQIEARIKIPDQRAKTEKELLLYIPRKKPKPEIKHHPQRLSADDGTSFVEAEILTSQMHLPVEDDDTSEVAGEHSTASQGCETEKFDVFAMLPETEAYEPDKVQEIASSTITTTTAPTTTTQVSTSTTAPPINHQKLHIKELNSTVEKSKLLASYGGIDADLLNNIALATGAPLDLEAEGGTQLVAYRARNTGRVPSTTLAPPSTISRSMVGRPKTTSPPKTPFERLAVDYKERLTGAGDMDKFLKTIYSNAYIALVDAKEASSVRIPMSMRRAQASLG